MIKVDDTIVDNIVKVVIDEYKKNDNDNAEIMFKIILGELEITDVNYDSVEYEEVGQSEKEQIKRVLSGYNYINNDACHVFNLQHGK